MRRPQVMPRRVNALVSEPTPDPRQARRKGLELLYVDLIAEKLARVAAGDVDLVFWFDISPAERARLRQIARDALTAAREGKQ